MRIVRCVIVKCAHAGVAVDFRLAGKPRVLDFSRGNQAFANLRGGFAGLHIRHLAEFHLWHLDVHINPVKQRPGNPDKIILDFARR